jgi:DNA-binding GntR family transcriptional regulator
MAEQKYGTLATELEKDIQSGRYGWEGGLPTVSELAEKWNMSINTIRQALTILESKGLIEQRVRGAGYYVKRIPFTMTETSLSAYVTVPRGYYCTNIGTTRRVTLPAYLQEKLQVPPSTQAVYRIQVSGQVSDDGTERPLQVAYRYHFMPVSDANVQRMQSDALYDPLWDDDGVPGEMHSHDEVSSRLATEGERDLLELPEHSSVMHLFEVIRDTGDVLFMAQDIVVSTRETLIFDFTYTHRNSK